MAVYGVLLDLYGRRLSNVIALEDRVRLRGFFCDDQGECLFPTKAIVAPCIMMDAVRMVRVTNMSYRLISICKAYRPMSASIISIFKRCDRQIYSQVLARRPYIVHVREVVVRSFLFREDRGALIGADIVVVARLTRYRGIKLRTRCLVGSYVVSSQGRYAFLPCVPLRGHGLALSFALSHRNSGRRGHRGGGLFRFVGFVLYTLFFFEL